MNSMWSSQPGGSGGWTTTGQTNNNSPAFRTLNPSFQLPMWGQGPYLYGPPPNFIGSPAMYHSQNWQIKGYTYPPQPPIYSPPTMQSEFKPGRAPKNTDPMGRLISREDKRTWPHLAARPGPARPLIVWIGHIQHLHGRDYTDCNTAKVDRKGKRRVTDEELDRAKEEDRLERDEEYWQYLRFPDHEISREPVPREVCQAAEHEEE